MSDKTNDRPDNGDTRRVVNVVDRDGTKETVSSNAIFEVKMVRVAVPNVSDPSRDRFELHGSVRMQPGTYQYSDANTLLAELATQLDLNNGG